MIAAGEVRLFRNRELLFTLTERQLRIRAKRTVVGVVWPVVAPFILLGLYAFVFGRVFTVPVDDYPAFLFAGLLPWTFLAQTLHGGLLSISSEPELVRRAPFPYELLPLANAAVMFLYFLASLVIFAIWLAVAGRLHLALLPLVAVPLLGLFLLVSSVAMLMALLDVYVRDLRLILGNLLTVWFFLVPIVYTQHMAPSSISSLRSIDPMNMIIGQFRDVLFFGHISRPMHMGIMFGICAVCFAVSLRIFQRFSVNLARDL